MKIVTILACVLITACSMSREWVMPTNVTREQATRDHYDCRTKALSATAATPDPWVSIGLRENIYESCMLAKGYQ